MKGSYETGQYCCDDINNHRKDQGTLRSPFRLLCYELDKPGKEDHGHHDFVEVEVNTTLTTGQRRRLNSQIESRPRLGHRHVENEEQDQSELKVAISENKNDDSHQDPDAYLEWDGGGECAHDSGKDEHGHQDNRQFGSRPCLQYAAVYGSFYLYFTHRPTLLNKGRESVPR